MAILLPIHEIHNSQTLNKLIQSYNLTPHDNQVERHALLKKIVEDINANMTPNEQLTDWIENEKGLREHMSYYKMNQTIKPITHRFKDALSELNEPLDSDEKNTKP